MLAYSYCSSHDCLVVQGCITAVLLSPTNMLLAGLNVHQCIEIFLVGLSFVPCHQILADLDVTNHFVVTTLLIS